MQRIESSPSMCWQDAPSEEDCGIIQVTHVWLPGLLTAASEGSEAERDRS